MTDLRALGSRAVLIGVSTYTSDALADVPAIADTVSDLRQALIDRCGMARERIRFLADPGDARELESAIVWEAQRTSGVLLVYYIGHGRIGPRGDLYLAVGRTDPSPGQLGLTAISYDGIRRQLTEQSPAQSIIVILDCCFSGLARTPDGAVDRGLASLTGLEGGLLITSSAREEHALAPEGDRYTAFTGQLLDLLSLGVPGGPAELTFRDAYRYLVQRLEYRDLPRPRWMSAGVADDIVLAVNPASDDLGPSFPGRSPQPSLPARSPTVGTGAAPVDPGIAVPTPQRGPAPAPDTQASPVPPALGSQAANGTTTVTTSPVGAPAPTPASATGAPTASTGAPTATTGAPTATPPDGSVATARRPITGAGKGRKATAGESTVSGATIRRATLSSPPGTGPGTSGGVTSSRRPSARALVAIAVAVAIVAAGAIVLPIWLSHGSSSSSRPPTAGPPASPTHSPTTNPPAVACATGTIQLIGSTAFEPLAQAAAGQYMSQCSGASVKVNPVATISYDSAYGLSQVQQAVQAHSGQAGSMIAMYDGLPTAPYTAGLTAHPVGALIFSVVAHTGLFPGSSISVQELKQIFGGTGQQGVVAVGRLAGSGSRLNLFRKVLDLQQPVSAYKASCPLPSGHAVSIVQCTAGSTAQVLNFVNGTPNAIGYAEIYGLLSSDPDVTPLSIGSGSPTSTDVLNGSYNYWTIEHLYSAPQPTALATDFLSYLIDNYFASVSGVIPCSQDPGKKLEADC
ncbi:MAG TPA: substrate-binding domain-containing protein [Trebonia sp.]|nr:substrate-binding domain-containing protein [Trebonia sp.]